MEPKSPRPTSIKTPTSRSAASPRPTQVASDHRTGEKTSGNTKSPATRSREVGSVGSTANDHSPAAAKRRDRPDSTDGATVAKMTPPSTNRSARRESNAKPSAEAAKQPSKRTTTKTPSAAEQLTELKGQLSTVLLKIDELTKERDEAQKSVVSLRDDHVQLVENLTADHRKHLHAMTEEYQIKLKSEIDKVVDQHSHEVNTLKLYHERSLREMQLDHEKKLAAKDEERTSSLARLTADHEAAIRELTSNHEQQLLEITDRFEGIKRSLSEKVDQLRAKCDELCSREMSYAASCKKDSDLRQQMALEVKSLEVVLDQKNDEIRRLRLRQTELETKLEEIPKLQASISKHQQQMENLEAIVSLKSDHERQLSEMHQQLLRRAERESKAVKRLSMNNDELMWRLSQSEIGPLAPTADDDPGSSTLGTPPALRVGASVASGGLMSRSYDSPRVMFHPTSSRPRPRSTLLSSSPPRTPAPGRSAGLQGPGSTTSGPDSSPRLRRSGTYDLVEAEQLERDAEKQ